MQVIRDAVRALRFAPGFTATALLVLALAIGASTIVFSVVDTVVIRRLPFNSPDRLVTIAETTPSGSSTTIAPEEFQVWQSFDVFSGLAAVGPTRTLDSGAAGDRLDAQEVSAGLFPVLRAQPMPRPGAPTMERRPPHRGSGLTVTILVGTALLVSSFIRLVTRDLGLDYRHVVAFNGVGAPSRDDAPADRVSHGQVWLANLLEQVRAVPSVDGAAIVSGGVPLSGGSSQTTITIAGQPKPADGARELIEVRLVTPDYFRVMGMTLRRGRLFSAADGTGAPQVVLLNEAAASRYFAGRGALGGRVTVGTVGEREVAGVLQGVRLGGPESETRAEAYVPLAQTKASGGALFFAISDRTTLRPQQSLVVLRETPADAASIRYGRGARISTRAARRSDPFGKLRVPSVTR